jgi:hypothetical protein
LSDADSAELLHRVSVSPEIRAIFRQHKELSEIAKNAARNVAVRPEIESKVFANIAALQEEERVGLAPIPESVPTPRAAFRRTAIGAALLAVLLAGSALYLELTRTNGASQLAPPQQAMTSEQPSVPGNRGTTDIGTAGTNETNVSSATGNSHTSHVGYQTQMSYQSNMSYQSQDSHGSNNAASLSNDIASSEQPSTTPDAPIASIRNIAPKSANSVAILDPDRMSRQKYQAGDIAEGFDRFEIGLETATGFNSPADRGSFTPFGEQRFHLGYFVTPNDQVGLRLTHAMYQTLEQQQGGMSGVYSSIDRTNVATWQLAKEGYYVHRFDLPGGLMLDGGAAAGLLDNGWLATLELGLKVPVSSHVLAGVSFSLSRVHSNAPTAQDLMEEGTSVPMILSGSDVHNTLNGRIQYGLSYRF